MNNEQSRQVDNLVRLFQSLRVEYGYARSRFFARRRLSKQKRSSYLKLAERFEQFRADGIPVDPVEYMRAHFDYYKGKPLYIEHLLADHSFQIYERYSKTARADEQITTADTSDEFETLRHLAHCRNESVEQVLLSAYGANIFTKEFLMNHPVFQNLLEQGKVDIAKVNAW